MIKHGLKTEIMKLKVKYIFLKPSNGNYKLLQC